MQLSADELAGDRGGERVFSGVSFSISDGQALTVTGPNGSGKSTLLRIIAGLLEPAEGSVQLVGSRMEWPTIASAAHYLGHGNAMKQALSVVENLGFWRRFLGEAHLDVEDALEMVGLADIGHMPFGYLSTGQRRRVAIARLLVSYRPLWLLDEPTSGLDRAAERQFAALMQAHREDGGMIVAATHLPLGLDDATQLRLGGDRATTQEPVFSISPGRGGRP